MSYIYVANPYTGPREKLNFQDVERFVAEWTRRGFILYSPVVHFHTLAIVHQLPTVFDFWREHNVTMLRHAKELWVYTLKGWDESKGVTYEIATAQSLLIPVKYKQLPEWKETENVSNL